MIIVACLDLQNTTIIAIDVLAFLECHFTNLIGDIVCNYELDSAKRLNELADKQMNDCWSCCLFVHETFNQGNVTKTKECHLLHVKFNNLSYVNSRNFRVISISLTNS